MTEYEQYKRVIKLLLENAEEYNSKISPPPSEALSASSLRTLSNVLEGRSLLSRPNYSIELYDTNMNDLFRTLLNLFANDMGLIHTMKQNQTLFTLRDKNMFDKITSALSKLGLNFKGIETELTRDGYYDTDKDVNNLSPFPGNMSIRLGIR